MSDAVRLLAGQGHETSPYFLKKHRTHAPVEETPAPTAEPDEDVLDNYEAATLRATTLDLTADEQDAYLAKEGLEMPPDWDAITLTKQTGELVLDDAGKVIERPLKHWVRLRNAKKTGVETTVQQVHPIVPPRIHIAARLPKRQPSDLKTAVVFGDAQRGFWQDPYTEKWHTTHDEAAIDVFKQVLADVEAEHGVDDLINTGDELDLPGEGRHRSAPVFYSKLAQDRTFDSCYRNNMELAALTPNAKRKWVLGNHEARWLLWLIDNSRKLVGLRRASINPAVEVPVLSLEFLLRVKESGWTLSDPYPEGFATLGRSTIVFHGDCARPTAALTASKYFKDYPLMNIGYGHTHRSGITNIVQNNPFGKKIENVAFNPGALCRRDGAVPSAKGGYTDKGTPIMKRGETWDQGLMVVHYREEDPTFTPLIEQIKIIEGEAFWRGRRYEARCDSDGVAL